MARQPVFVDPPDILDALTEPVPEPKPPAHAPALPSVAAEDPTESASAPPLRRPSSGQPIGPIGGPTLAEPPTRDLETPRARRARPRDRDVIDRTQKRLSPNVSLYLPDAAKDELMKLKIDLKLDYTDIVLDALKARHPRRNWGR